MELDKIPNIKRVSKLYFKNFGTKKGVAIIETVCLILGLDSNKNFSDISDKLLEINQTKIVLV